MRASMTGTELRIWIRKRRRQLNGWKFWRQQPIGPYYVDFYCPAARLVVEIDGPGHEFDASWAYDLRRQAWLEAEGYRVVRLHVSLIDQDVGAAIETIEAALGEQEQLGLTRQPLRRLTAAPPHRWGGAEPYCFGSSLIDAELMQ